MAATFGCLEPFDATSEDWSGYMERMGEFFVANGITEDRKQVAVFLSSFGPSTYRLLKNLLAPSVPSSIDITVALKSF